LAAFVWPALFIGGAGAIAAPILIHFFARRRYRRIRWAATEFLLRAVRRNKRRVWLEDLILMLMRCLAVLLIALLVARPFFKPEGLAGMVGGGERTERIFVIDDSFSMGYVSGATEGETSDADTSNEEGSSFDRAKQAVVRLVELLVEQSPNDTVTVLTTSAMRVPLATGVFLDQRQTEELFARIAGLSVSQAAMTPRDTCQAVRQMLDDQPATVSATVYLVGDFQRKDWTDGGGASTSGGNASDSKSASAIAPLADWGSEPRGLKLVLVDVGDDDARNLAIAGLESARSRFVAGVDATVHANIANHSGLPADSLDLEVTVGTSVLPTVVVGGIPANDATQVPITVTAPRPGWEWVRVAAPGDGLTVDDTRTLAIEAVDAVRILIVNGEPSSDPYRDEVALLSTALRPPGEVFSGNSVRVIDETEFEETSLDDVDVVILANVFRVGESAAELLTRFVRSGGGVAIFLGDQVDADLYNTTLYDEGRGLLPARLEEQRSAPGAGAQLVADARLHAMVSIFSGADNPFIKQISFQHYFACAPAAADDGTPSGEQAVVVAHYDDPSGSPAIIDRPFGAGRVTLFTSSCDQEWNDWAKDPSYVVALLELTQYLARGRGAETDLLVGSPIEFDLDLSRYTLEVRVRTPAYPAEQELELTATPAEDGDGFRVRWELTHQSGVYQFFLAGTDGAQDVRAVAVNLDPNESDLAPATESDLRQSLHELPFTYVDGLKSLEAVGQDARREFWKAALLAAMIVLMGEQLLGWWFGRR